jgi:hypothetical protein
MLTPKKLSRDSPATHAALKTMATEKAVSLAIPRRSCCDWLLAIVTNKGTAPTGFTMTSTAVNIFTYSVNVSIYTNRYL